MQQAAIFTAAQMADTRQRGLQIISEKIMI